MYNNQRTLQLKQIAPTSRLIAIIDALQHCREENVLRRWQQRVKECGLRFSVSSPEGRLELICYLVVGKKDHVTGDERKALQLLYCSAGSSIFIPWQKITS